VKIVLDASMTLAWHLNRVDPSEATLAAFALDAVRAYGAIVPTLWFPEVANALLVAERRRVRTVQDTTRFQSDLSILKIAVDSNSPYMLQSLALSLGRSSNLTAYDAIYLELALRTGFSLATFDHQLANAFRNLGGHVFGDLP
jgi:predicted nucleic acid-binding protein